MACFENQMVMSPLFLSPIVLAPVLYAVLLSYIGISTSFVGFAHWLLLEQRDVGLGYYAQTDAEI